jgi:hypothetical protein
VSRRLVLIGLGAIAAAAVVAARRRRPAIPPPHESNGHGGDAHEGLRRFVEAGDRLRDTTDRPTL